MNQPIVNAMTSRRAFLKSAGVATLAAAMSAGIGHTAARAEEAIEWDAQADVVIVGAGAGGLAAADILSEAGKSVIVIEYESSIAGSNSSLCAGMIQGCCTSVQEAAGVSDSVDEYDKLLEALAEGAEKPELRRLFAENCGETIDWLIDRGIEFSPDNLSTSGTMNDFYTDVTPSVPRMHVVSSYSGSEITTALYDRAVAQGAQFMFETEATELVTQDGVVTGVRAIDADDNEIAIGAGSAVLMNSGGFTRNVDMLRSLATPAMPGMFTDRPIMASYGSSYQKGTGTLMCMAVGAGIHAPFQAYQYAPGIAGNPEINAGGFIGTPGIYVSLDGKRHINESRDSMPPECIVGEIWKQEQGYVWAIWDQPMVDEAPVHYMSPDLSAEVDAGYVFKAETIEELAQAIGLDPDTLAQTVAEFNEGVASGTDPLGRTDGVAIQTAPFYAGRVIAVTPDTSGGVTVDTQLRVTNALGEVIPHLYAVGNMVGGFKGKVCVGCGQAIGWSYTSGRLAAADILAQE